MRNPVSKRLSARRSRAATATKLQSARGTAAEPQPFDMAKIHYEAERRNKRRILIRRTLPLVILVAVAALWFLLPFPLTHQAIKNYDHKNYHGSRNWLTPVTWSSPQPFVAFFDSGTADTQLRNYKRAESELTKALALAPPDKRCMVLQNLVYALQAHAGSLKTDGKGKEAADLNSQATSYMDNNTKCFHNLPEKDKQAAQVGGGGGGGGGGAQAEANQILSATQQEQLQQKNQLGQQTQQQDFQQNNVDPNSPDIRPW